MKRLRTSLLLAFAIAILASATWWANRRVGFATPAECIDAYCEACRAGDVGGYLKCLGEPLHSEIRQRYGDPAQLAEFLRTSFQETKSWVQQLDPVAEGSTAEVEVDEVRLNGTRRVRFRLERSSRGWLTVGVDRPREIPIIVPFGTHVGKGKGG